MQIHSNTINMLQLKIESNILLKLSVSAGLALEHGIAFASLLDSRAMSRGVPLTRDDIGRSSVAHDDERNMPFYVN